MFLMNVIKPDEWVVVIPPEPEDIRLPDFSENTCIYMYDFFPLFSWVESAKIFLNLVRRISNNKKDHSYN